MDNHKEYQYDGFATNEQRLYYLNTGNNSTNLSKDRLMEALDLECHNDKQVDNQMEHHCNP